MILTVENITNAMRGSAFWLYPDSESARIVAESELEPTRAAAFTTYRASDCENLGPATVGEIEKARDLYRQQPTTYLANNFASPDRSGTRVFVDGPFRIFPTSNEWTTENVSALCRGLGLREFKSLTESEGECRSACERRFAS